MDIMSKFSERLRELMQDEEINPPALAKKLNTHRTNITRYLRGDRLPQLTTFLLFLDYFSCSADFLLGLTDREEKNFKERPPFSERFSYLIKEKEISMYRLTREIKISEALLYQWRDGKQLPSIENLVKLAKYFDCTVDFLLGREK